MTQRGREAAALLTGAAGGSFVTLLALAQKARAAPPEGIDPQLWEMLTNLVEAVAVQSQEIEQLTASLNSLVITLGGAPPVLEVAGDPFENTDRFVTGQVICTVINQGFQLPSFPIPKNKQLVVKALPGNVGWIYLGVTQADSQNLTVAYILLPNEGVGLLINNSDRVWVNAPAPPVGALNDGVTFIVEMD